MHIFRYFCSSGNTSSKDHRNRIFKSVLASPTFSIRSLTLSLTMQLIKEVRDLTHCCKNNCLIRNLLVEATWRVDPKEKQFDGKHHSTEGTPRLSESNTSTGQWCSAEVYWNLNKKRTLNVTKAHSLLSTLHQLSTLNQPETLYQSTTETHAKCAWLINCAG